MKLGLDLHGTIDDNPDYFCRMAKRNVSVGGEVHIITGESWSEKLEAELLEYNRGVKWWTHFFSIDDHLKSRCPFTINTCGRREYDRAVWNAIKAEYCRRVGIDMHFDDCKEYLYHFTTPCMLYLPQGLKESYL